MIRITVALALAIFSSGSWALNTSGFRDAPVTRLTEAEVKEFFVTIEKALDSAADGTTVEWKAPQTPFVSKITPQKRFSEGGLDCREATIESDSRDRFQRGLYTFCKGKKGGWQFKLRPQAGSR